METYKNVFVNTRFEDCHRWLQAPDEVKFLLIDPKTVELVDYIGIPHLIFPTITDVKQANYALEWVVEEVRKRYEKFNQSGVRNIESFNLKMKKERKKCFFFQAEDGIRDKGM